MSQCFRRYTREVKRLAVLVLLSCGALAQHLGFDKNEYPGDVSLPALRKTFDWTGYWLSDPPGANSNTWKGKRAILRKHGFGFALLYRGRTQQELRSGLPSRYGTADAHDAARAAHGEGFRSGSVIYLDLEEGGRLTAEQANYVSSFLRTLRDLNFTPGLYCSGIAVADGPGSTITTIESAKGLRMHDVEFWVANDSCPPSPGCRADRTLNLSQSGTPDASIWQYSQTPRRPQFAGAACAQTYASDSRCYAPATQVFVDMNVSRTADPSRPVH